MKLEKIEGYKIKYRMAAWAGYTTTCPFRKDQIKVGSCACDECKKQIGINVNHQFVICKGNEV